MDNLNVNELEQSAVRALAVGCGYNLYVCDSVDSTNNELKRWAAKGSEGGCVLMAREQTAGKGRLGRSFFSPRKGLYYSLLLRPNTPPEETLYFTTAAAVAVCRAIEAASGRQAQIKWVNDVYLGERKVCGILTESSLSGGLTEWAIIGIGINITPPKGGFPDEIAGRACAIFDNEEDCPAGFANLLAARLSCELEKALSEPRAENIAEYRRRSFIVGRDITAVDGGRERRCRVLSIDDKAELEVRYENGELGRLYSGEISVKL